MKTVVHPRHWALILFLWVVLLGTVWSQTPSPSPSPAPAALSLALLIIGDHTNPGMSNIEKVLTENIRQELAARGIAGRALPIIFYHMDKPAEKKYCEVKLHIQPAQLLFAGVVQHENFVVRAVLFKAEQIQVPEAAAQSLVDAAVDYLQRPVLPALPSPPVDTTPINTQPPEEQKKAFTTYSDAMSSLVAEEGALQQQYQQSLQSQRSGQISAATFLELLNGQLIPGARDLEAASQKVPVPSAEVLHLHQSFLECTSYRVKQLEALSDGLGQKNQTLVHLADNYGQLAASARSRWHLEYEALAQKYQ